jgi:tetratricopeptide (TPR) repeat protein
LQRAIALYGRVLDIDPNYVPAWVWMAAAHNDLAPFTAGPDQAMHSQLFRDYIEKALVIDPDNAVALAVSSAMSAQDGDIETAVAKMKLALRIAPNDLQVIRTSIFPLMYLGKWDQVVKVLEYAFDRDPLSLVSRINLVLTYGGVGNYEQAIELAEQSLAMNSDDLNARYILGIATIQTGDAEAGLRISEDIPLPFLRHKIATLAYHALGDMQSYESGIDAMRQLVIDGAEFASHGALAEAYAMTGNFDAAFAELDKSMENGEPPVFFDYPIFWGMFDDPRWDELMTRSGMPREKIEAIDFDVVLPDK